MRKTESKPWRSIRSLRRRGRARADGIDEIYARYIRRRLSEEGLMPQQKVEVLDCLLTYLRSPSGARLPGSTDE